jgi:hypothetical protein
MKKNFLPPIIALIVLITLLVTILSLLTSCKKAEEPKEPFYDDIVLSGEYLNHSRWGTSMKVYKSDSLRLELNIGSGNSIRQYILRKNIGGIGYEWTVTNKVLRFKAVEGGYEIAGDTLNGWFFKRLF